MVTNTPVSTQIMTSLQSLDPNVKNGLMVLLFSSSIFLYYWRRSSSTPSRPSRGSSGNRLGRNRLGRGGAGRKREVADKEFAERVERLNLQRLQSLAEKDHYNSLKSWEKFEYIFKNNVIAEIIPLVDGFSNSYAQPEEGANKAQAQQQDQDPEEKTERCLQQHAFLTEKILMTLFKFDDIDIEHEVSEQRRAEIKIRRKEIIRQIQGYNRQIDEIVKHYK
ncbi:hypothetical protein NADFUDRAFT_48394 [Nadsonia fulvescens var. elongata DSM 6958]|uniref:BAG domain-containing protein n=1 Tax=Nadsonia fulvescens var. elongata DSM 6958 TaxID=857566 RepID=A0A1E3PQY1_9ASCO|nr:hypothetical protein NADFUDRAFT_48394 [Nadsonia fulvescens var. elongata DSM 6958]